MGNATGCSLSKNIFHVSKILAKKFIRVNEQFTTNILDFLFKLYLIFTIMGSSRAQVEKVQAYQTWQFTSNMLIFFI
jgi:hypothetical protein